MFSRKYLTAIENYTGRESVLGVDQKKVGKGLLIVENLFVKRCIKRKIKERFGVRDCGHLAVALRCSSEMIGMKHKTVSVVTTMRETGNRVIVIPRCIVGMEQKYSSCFKEGEWLHLTL